MTSASNFLKKYLIETSNSNKLKTFLIKEGLTETSYLKFFYSDPKSGIGLRFQDIHDEDAKTKEIIDHYEDYLWDWDKLHDAFNALEQERLLEIFLENIEAVDFKYFSEALPNEEWNADSKAAFLQSTRLSLISASLEMIREDLENRLMAYAWSLNPSKNNSELVLTTEQLEIFVKSVCSI